MPINPFNRKKILVIHGINPGTDEDIIGHKRLIKALSNRAPDSFEYDVSIVKYESINDKAQLKFFTFNSEFLASLMAERTISYTVDLVGDVFVYINQGDAALQIRKKIKDSIMENYYNEGCPLTVVAHSLGSLYAFDAIGELIIENPNLFDPNDRKTWPVQSFVTVGSPIGLVFFSERSLPAIGQGQSQLRWYNFFDRNDPVVTGNVFGQQTFIHQFAEAYHADGWFIKDVEVVNGGKWLTSHTSYWENNTILDHIISLASS